MKALIDWLDVRLGVRDFYGTNVCYTLPGDSLNLWWLFGGLATGCIILQFITGFYMLFYYVPVPEVAHESIKAMCATAPLGALARNVHRWSCTLGIAFVFIHMIHVMAKRAYRTPRELNWWTGLLLAFIYALLLITGIIMPWDWRSYWELIIWVDWIALIPGVGHYLKDPILANFTLGRNFGVHIMLLPVAIIAVWRLHIILARRLGLSSGV
jgi:quinol-cytochrome oxidoreductase complex cytochrome b subunit